MKHFFSFFTTNKRLGFTITFGILLIGFFSFFQLQKDTFPSIDLDELLIETPYFGQSSKDIERLITKPIEEAIHSISGIKKYKSQSVEGNSYIRIYLDEATNTKKVKDHIYRNINAISTFPSDLKQRPQITEFDNSAFAVIELSLSGFRDKEEKYQLSKDLLNDFEDLQTVSLIETFGFRKKEVHILLKADALETYQISSQQIQKSIQAQNLRATLGNINTSKNSQPIISDNKFSSLESIENTIIQSNFGGQIIKLSDLANVELTFEEPQDFAHINGEDAVTYRLYKTANADIIKSINAIKNTVQLQGFPDYIKKTYTQDSSYYLQNRLNVMFSNGLIGLVFILLVLPLFLPLSLSIWVAIGIPTCLAGCFAGLLLFDQSINVLSLLAMILIVGIIVDDAIIVVENIAQEYEKGLSPSDAATSGISKVFLPVLTTMLTTFVAFSPMFFIKGVMGKFVFIIPLVVGIALFVSLIELSFALPAHISRSLNQKKNPSKTWRMRFIATLQYHYERLLLPCLNQPKKTLIIGFLIFVGVLMLARTVLDFELFSDKASQRIVVECEFPKQTSLKSNKAGIKAFENLLLAESNQDITGFSTRIGYKGAYSYRKAKNIRYSQIIIDLSPAGHRKRSARAIVADLQPKLKHLNQFKSILFHIDAGGPPVGKPISIHVTSNDDTSRTEAVLRIKKALNAIPHSINVTSNDEKEGLYYNVNLNQATLASLGIKTDMILDTLRRAFDGKKVSSIYLGADEYDILVKFDQRLTKDINDIYNLSVSNNQGRLIPISKLVRISKEERDPTIFHYNGKQSVTVNADIDKSQTSVVKILSLLQKEIDFKGFKNTKITIGGEGDETKKSINELLKSFFLAAVGIYFLLMLLFKSSIQPLLVMLAIPAGIVGVIIAFALHQMPFSFIGIIGTIGLCGVVVNDSLILVNYTNKLRDEGTMQPKAFVLKAAKDRLRPILLTSITTIAGLMPLAYGIGGQDLFIQPMALAMSYGLFFATPLILFILPCLYLITCPKQMLKSQSVSFDAISIDEKNKDSEHLAPTKERRIAP